MIGWIVAAFMLGGYLSERDANCQLRHVLNRETNEADKWAHKHNVLARAVTTRKP